MSLDTEFVWDYVNNPNREQIDYYVNRSQPFVLSNMVPQWPAYTRWANIQDLVEKIGAETVVPVRRNVELSVEYNSGTEWLGETEQIQFGEFIQQWKQHSQQFGTISPNSPAYAVLHPSGNNNNNNNSNNSNNNNNSSTRPPYYLASLPINKHFPSLQEDVVVPPQPAEQNKPGNLWIGNAGQITPVHYDFSTGDPGMDGIHAVLQGRKVFRLFDPQKNAPYFPRKKQWGRFHQAVVGPDGLPDVSQFPQFKNAKYIQIELKEGEALFIPKLWWHYVITLTPSIAVNFWFQHMGSEVLKLTRHWEHMEEYLKVVEQMEISLDKMRNVLQFYGYRNLTDEQVQRYIDNTHQFMLLPQFLHTFSNGTRAPWTINHPQAQYFAEQITNKTKEWVLSRMSAAEIEEYQNKKQT